MFGHERVSRIDSLVVTGKYVFSLQVIEQTEHTMFASLKAT